MVTTEISSLVTLTNIISYVTWGFPLLTLTIVAYAIEYYTKFKARWKIFLISTILALTYPIENSYEYWAYRMPITENQIIVNTILLLGLLIGGYASVSLLKFQNIDLGKTKSLIEALCILGVLVPLTLYATGHMTSPMILVMTTYNLSVAILMLIFITIGKLAYRYIPKHQKMAYASARLGALLLLFDPLFVNYNLLAGALNGEHYWLRLIGILIQVSANILLIITVILLVMEAKARGVHLLPSTEQKPSDGRPIKYRLKEGYSYLTAEYSNEKSFEIFTDYITHGFFGLVITRTSPARLRADYSLRTTPILWMTKAETDEKSIRPNELDRLLLIIKDFMNSQKNCITLLQRLDYLVTENGFTRTLKFIHDLNDAVVSGESILLVSVDPSTMSAGELALLRKELEDVSYADSMTLNEPLYEVLLFVYDENTKRKTPSFKSVTKKFEITKTTARKRIYALENKGLIRVLEQGKFKMLEVTERGRGLLKSPVGPKGGE